MRINNREINCDWCTGHECIYGPNTVCVVDTVISQGIIIKNKHGYIQRNECHRKNKAGSLPWGLWWDWNSSGQEETRVPAYQGMLGHCCLGRNERCQ